jgi:superfamily I DNA and RNA helicase
MVARCVSIVSQDITSEAAYIRAERRGRGKPVPDIRRPALWSAITQVVQELQRQGKSTFRQLVNEAARQVNDSLQPRYDHVIVDESQGLHPAQWRLLRAIVPPGPDDLFIVGDRHQRIYDNRVSLTSLGIPIPALFSESPDSA